MTMYKLLFALGICPFIVPFIYYFIILLAHNTSMPLIELLLLWSYLYWPLYVLGLLLVIFSLYKIKKDKD